MMWLASLAKLRRCVGRMRWWLTVNQFLSLAYFNEVLHCQEDRWVESEFGRVRQLLKGIMTSVVMATIQHLATTSSSIPVSCVSVPIKNDHLLSECPKSFSGAITSRTRRFSSFADGKPPSDLRSQIVCPATNIRKSPGSLGRIATSPSSLSNVCKSSWLSQEDRSSHLHLTQ